MHFLSFKLLIGKIKIILLPILLATILTTLTFSSFFGQYYWVFEIISHFHMQYAIGLIICLLIQLLIPRKRLHALWFLPALSANLLILGPFFLPPTKSSTSTTDYLRVLTINVFAHNDTLEKVIAYINDSKANIVLLSEARPEFMALLNKTISKEYLHIHDASQRGHFGIALLSKHPLIKSQTNRLGIRQYPSIEAAIDWQGNLVRVYGVHPNPPISARETKWRDSELAAIGEVLASKSDPLILMGDLNAAPWSYITQQLSAKAGLQHAALGHGIWPTWRLGSILLGTPIDSILVSSQWVVKAYNIGEDVGSDHYPVIADLVLP